MSCGLNSKGLDIIQYEKPDYILNLENKFRKQFFRRLQTFLYNERNVKEFQIEIESISTFTEPDYGFVESKPVMVRPPLNMRVELVVHYLKYETLKNGWISSAHASYVDYVFDSIDDYKFTLRKIESNKGTVLEESGEVNEKPHFKRYNLPCFPIHFTDLYKPTEELIITLG